MRQATTAPLPAKAGPNAAESALDAALLTGRIEAAPDDGRDGGPDRPGAFAEARRAGLVALLALCLYAAGSLEFLEQRLIELRFPLAPSTPTDDVLIVTIDRESLDAVGVWPWPRRLHGLALDRLQAAGAAQVAFDVDFSARSDPENDGALERALARADPPARLAVFTDLTGPEPVDVGPGADLLDHALPVLASVSPEADGRVWRTAPQGLWGGAPVPAIFAELAPGDRDPAPFWIDYGIDPGGLAVLPFVAVVSGRFDPEAVRGRRVLIGATAVELGDLAPVPRFGQLPGPVVQALAAQSVLLDRRLRRAHPAAVAALAFAAALASAIAARQRGVATAALAATATCAALFVFAVAAQRAAPVLLDVAPAMAAALIGLVLNLAARATRLDVRLLANGLALRRAQALMGQVAENLSEGVAVIAPGAGVTAMNRAAETMFPNPDGALVSMLRGRRPERSLVWPRLRDPAAMEAALRAAAGSGRRRAICRRPGGSRFYAEVTVTALPERVGEGWIVLARDVTAMVAAERDARRRERRLIDLTIRAEAATRAKTEFVATMSHELRTPLNAIIGCNGMMADEAFGPLGAENYRTMATEARNSGARLLRVLTHILDYANADLDKLDIDLKPTNLNALVSEAIGRQTGRAGSSGVSVETELPTLPTVARVDPAAIEKAFGNILSNAIRFSTAGGVVQVTVTALEGRRARIVVSDRGIGMTPTFLKRCCEPFEQAETAGSRNFEGAGLGLTVARAFIHRHGGALEIASTPGEGTVATITLPQ